MATSPARLKEEIAGLADAIVDGKDIRADEMLEKHADWVAEFLPQYASVTEENITEILHAEVGKVFVKVLEDAGVYKCTPEGRELIKDELEKAKAQLDSGEKQIKWRYVK